MSHPAFTARPNYKHVRSMSLPELRKLACEALKAGQLNITTLWFHRQCWMRSRTAKDYLQYLLCRRQFGYALSTGHQRRVHEMTSTAAIWLFMKGIRRHQQRQLRCLLNEALEQTHTAGPQQQLTRHWLTQQAGWQAQWFDSLAQSQRVHVVGNSPHILGLGLGSNIDRADVVIRFNHFRSEHTSADDIGQKLSAWVVAPGYQGPRPVIEQGQPVIIAGPAMLYMQQRFSHLTGDAGEQSKILHIPLTTWRKQVRRFAAPPSAGALMLGWLLQLKSEHQLPFTLQGFGFGYDVATQTRYHSAKPGHRPVARHNWDAEHTWMKSILSK